jgi:hypothetical protein
MDTKSLVVDLGPIFNLWGAISVYEEKIRLNDLFMGFVRCFPLFCHHGVKKTFHHQDHAFFIDHLTYFIEEKLTNLCPNLLICTFSPS